MNMVLNDNPTYLMLVSGVCFIKTAKGDDNEKESKQEGDQANAGHTEQSVRLQIAWKDLSVPGGTQGREQVFGVF